MIQTKARSYLLKTKYKYFHHEQRILFYPRGRHFHLIQLHLDPLAFWFLSLPSPSTDITSRVSSDLLLVSLYCTSYQNSILLTMSFLKTSSQPDFPSALIFLGDLPLLGSYWGNCHPPKPRVSTNLYAKDSHRFLMVSTIISS